MEIVKLNWHLLMSIFWKQVLKDNILLNIGSKENIKKFSCNNATASLKCLNP